MTRPRRQSMAKGNVAIAESKGKNHVIKEAEKALKSAKIRTKIAINRKKTKTKFTMAEKETPMEQDDDEEEEEEEETVEEEVKMPLRSRRNIVNNKVQFVDAARSSAPEKAAKKIVVNRKRSLPEPSTSVTGDAKRLKAVIERLPRHQRGIGFVLTFGQGDVGQLGLGNNAMEKKRPCLVNLPTKMADVCAGGMHTVCLSEDGKVFTFGCNDEGALGRDTSEEDSEFEPGEVEIDGRVIQISAGDSHSAALTDAGDVYAWGTFRDSSGAMGLLKSQCIEQIPHLVMPGVSVAKIASGSDHLVLLTTQGHLYTCGCAEQGQLGRVAECFTSRGGRKGLGLLLTPGLAVVRRQKGKQVLFDDVWTGAYATFVRIRGTTDVYVCGLNNYFQLGSEDIKNHYVLERSETFSSKSWVQIAGGQHHTLALDVNGDVYTMGRKEYGRLGLGENTQDLAVPTVVPELVSKNCIDIACGVATSYAVDSLGRAYSWGMGTNCALGTGEEEDVFEPVRVMGKNLEGKRNIAVSAGGQHAVLLAAPDNQPAE
uniref:RCC1-like domain-containing protein n=1 Tax=Strigamia maritima TaxID=126957 RepID=T1J8U9_STRMM